MKSKQTFELNGVVTAVEREHKCGIPEQWIDCHLIGPDGLDRITCGIPIPADALSVLMPGRKIKITVTVRP